MSGAWNLHELTRTMELDWFVGYSSIAAVLGSPGQANYATANAFLDGLMQYRQQQQLPGMSIQWGPWSGGGMTAGQDRRRWEQMGLETIAPSAGSLLLDMLWAQDAANVGVFPVDWSRFLRQFPRAHTPRLLAELSATHAVSAVAATARSESAPRQRILAAGERERPRLIHDLIARDVAKTLGIPAAALDRDKPLSQMGLDSLMGIELKNAIESKLAVEIPLERFTTGTTVSQLAEILQELLGVEGAVTEPPAAEAPGTPGAPGAPGAATAARRLEDIDRSDYDVREFPELRELQQRLAFFASLGIENPYFDVHERVTNDTAVIRGREMINFSSYNYLGSSGRRRSARRLRPPLNDSAPVFLPAELSRGKRRSTASWNRPSHNSWGLRTQLSLSVDTPPTKPPWVTCSNRVTWCCTTSWLITASSRAACFPVPNAAPSRTTTRRRVAKCSPKCAATTAAR